MKKYSLFLVTLIFLLNGCASTLPQGNKKESYIYQDYKDTLLYKNALSYSKVLNFRSGFYPLGDPQAALIARLSIIQMAQSSIELQSYIFTEDETGNLMAWYLYEAAERGVRVRVLLDDMEQRNDNILVSLSAHPNIEIRLFNPFINRAVKKVGFINDFDRVNRRMHNKALIADGSFAIAGGRNIADEYFSADHNLDFGDLDLLLIGKITPQIAEQFDLYWNSQPAIPVENLIEDPIFLTQEKIVSWKKAQAQYLVSSNYANSLKTHNFVQLFKNKSIPFYFGKALLHYDLPEKAMGKNDELLVEDITNEIKKSKKDFFLISPYFVPTQEGAEQLLKMVKKGVRVRILTNSLASNDVYSVHGWYAKYREMLIKGGVELFETKVGSLDAISSNFINDGKSSLHAKTFIVDSKKIFVGSFNFDPRSAFLNTELGIFVDSPKFAILLLDNIEQLLEKNAYRLTLDSDGYIQWYDSLKNNYYDSDPHSSLFLKFKAKVAGLLPVEDQL